MSWMVRNSWHKDGERILVSSSDGTAKVYTVWESLEDLITYAKECCMISELTDAEREQFGLPPR
jgi:hypothetical protein